MDKAREREIEEFRERKKGHTDTERDRGTKLYESRLA
jgi:hypothetical protein